MFAYRPGIQPAQALGSSWSPPAPREPWAGAASRSRAQHPSDPHPRHEELCCHMGGAWRVTHPGSRQGPTDTAGDGTGSGIKRTGFSLSMLISGSRMVMEGHCCTPSLTLAQKLAPVILVHSCCREHLKQTEEQLMVYEF